MVFHSTTTSHFKVIIILIHLISYEKCIKFFINMTIISQLYIYSLFISLCFELLKIKYWNEDPFSLVCPKEPYVYKSSSVCDSWIKIFDGMTSRREKDYYITSSYKTRAQLKITKFKTVRRGQFINIVGMKFYKKLLFEKATI